MVEAVALGDRAGEHVVVEHAGGWSSASSSVIPGLARRLDGLLDALAVGEVELDDHVLQEAAGADLARAAW